MLLIPLWPAAKALWSHVNAPIPPVQKLYSNIGNWLNEHTPATSSVGYFEIGFMGYHAERRIIDPVGLVNPGVSEKVSQANFKCGALLSFSKDQPLASRAVSKHISTRFGNAT